jgi:hypothetical protein
MRAPHDEDVSTMIGRSGCDNKGGGAEPSFFTLLTLAVRMM